MRWTWMAAACLAVVTAACGGGEKPAEPASTATANPAVSPASNASTGGSEFGVRECDEYMAKYTECVSSKVPEQVRAAMVAALDQSKAQ